MNKGNEFYFALWVFFGVILWGPAVALPFRVACPEGGVLPLYLVSKGSFVAVLLLGMGRFGGLKSYGMNRIASWWFLIPALPLLLLAAAISFAPNAVYGLGVSAAIGWIFVSGFVGIGEECVFRGVIWRALENYGVLWKAAMTSALFGAVHLVGLFSEFPWQIIVSQAIFAFGVGMMFAAVRIVSGSLIAPILLHALFDGAAILAAGGLESMMSDTLSVGALLVPGMLFALWGFACILWTNRKRTSKLAIPAPS